MKLVSVRHLKLNELHTCDSWITLGTRESRNTPKQAYVSIRLPWRRRMYDIHQDKIRIAHPIKHFVFFSAEGPAPA